MNTNTNEREATNEATNEATATAERPRDHGLERLRTSIEGNEAGIVIAKATKPRSHEAVASLAVYVPSTTNGNEKIPQREFTQRTERTATFLCSLFGGCTVWPTLGYWLNEAGILVDERINVVKTATDPASLAEHYDEVMNMVIMNGRSWRQSSMAIDVNGILTLIDI